MFRKMMTIGLLVAVTAILTGCATSEKPYGLTGKQQVEDQRYVDSKGHYRADLQSMGVKAR